MLQIGKGKLTLLVPGSQTMLQSTASDTRSTEHPQPLEGGCGGNIEMINVNKPLQKMGLERT